MNPNEAEGAAINTYYKPLEQPWRDDLMNDPDLMAAPKPGTAPSSGDIGIPPWTYPEPATASLVPAFLIGGAVAAIVVVILKWKGNNKRRSR